MIIEWSSLKLSQSFELFHYLQNKANYFLRNVRKLGENKKMRRNKLIVLSLVG